MKLEIQNNNTSHYVYIRDGIAGNKQTVFQMVHLVQNTVNYDKGFNDFVNQFAISQGFTAYTENFKPETVIKSVYDFVKNNIAYLSDKAGKIESIKTARETLATGYGDCDDLAILIASMLAVLGFEDIHFVMASYDNSNSYQHIYVEVFADDKRFVVDTANGLPFNQELPTTNQESLHILKHDFTTRLLGAVFNAKQQTKRILKQTVNTIPYALQFMPLGFLPANLLLQGVNLITSADINSLSLSELGTTINQELDDLANLIINKQIAFDYAKYNALQIASQLGTYEPSKNEQKQYQVIQNSIKNKVKYIYSLIDNSDVDIKLNAKGMLIAGSAIVGFISYQLYKKGSY